ncbi:DUF1641 domain-containing protein [Deinococcus altitudinis]|uniref:DUF1641 domain-containing protein n=1 Tax=Deinococcus altitudinis TaxID=468914 RepID=UPI00389153B3
MAQRLMYTPHVKTSEEKLAEAQNDSNAALLEGLELLRELHEAGVLETLVKLVRGGEGLLGKTLHVLEGDSSTRLIRNVLELTRTASEIDPEALGSIGRAASAGISEGAKRVQKGDGVGLGELLGLLKDRDVQVALGALFGTLKGFGRSLRDSNGETTETPAQRRPEQPLNENRTARKNQKK